MIFMAKETCAEAEKELLELVGSNEPCDSPKFREKLKKALECRQKVESYMDFLMVVPKNDNSGVPIKQGTIKDIELAMSRKFHGITIFQDVLGCGPVSEEESSPVVCEKVMVFTATAPKEEAEEKYEWLKGYAGDLGKRLGQGQVYTSMAHKGVKMIKGEFKERVPEETA